MQVQRTAGNGTTIQHDGMMQPRSSHPLPEPNSLLSLPKPLCPRGHQPHSWEDTRFTATLWTWASHRPSQCCKHQTHPNPQMMGWPDGVRGISCFRQSGEGPAGATSREAKAAPLAHTASAAPKCSWSCRSKTAIPRLQRPCTASKAGIPGLQGIL